MKCLSLIVSESSKGEFVELLRSTPAVSAYTIFTGEGHAANGIPAFESAHDEVVGYVPRIRIDLIVDDDAVRSVVDKLCQRGPSAGKVGLYWVSPVEQMGEL
jgi:nitrogen regulatory protein PII